MLNKFLVESELGPIESVHKRTLTYRIIAIFTCSFLLLIAIPLNDPFGLKEGLICGLCAAVFLGIAFWFESLQLVVCKMGLAIGRNNKFKTIKWDAIQKLTIMYSMTESPQSIYSVILISKLGSQITFDMNWTNRKPLIAAIQMLDANEKIERFSIIKTGL